MTDTPDALLRLSALSRNAPKAFEIVPDANARAALARELGVLGIKKLRLEGALTPLGKSDWRLDARLGATVVQPCVATLAPVTTRVEDSVTRSYLAAYDEPEGGGEVEMPEDETVEGLPVDLDLAGVMAESLALALPAYPRAEGANPVAAQISEPGIAPLTDDDVKPFAGLAGLRDQLKDDDDA